MHITSTGIPLPIVNIDTDQIIPAAFLKLTTKAGYGKHLFHHWRYNADGDANPDFVLNQPAYNKGQILIAGKNFGCGSSREHAAWAIADFGIKAVVSEQIADIHKENEYKNGILPIELSSEKVAALLQLVKHTPEAEIHIDLAQQTLTAPAIGLNEHFEINAFKKECLLAGMDETDYLIGLRNEITAYEQRNAL